MAKNLDELAISINGNSLKNMMVGSDAGDLDLIQPENDKLSWGFDGLSNFQKNDAPLSHRQNSDNARSNDKSGVLLSASNKSYPVGIQEEKKVPMSRSSLDLLKSVKTVKTVKTVQARVVNHSLLIQEENQDVDAQQIPSPEFERPINEQNFEEP